MRETDLYGPIKTFLEGQGYAVKGEVTGCDVVAVRGDEPPVIIELKTRFSLALVLQGIARQAMTDAVYLAVPPPPGKTRRGAPKDILGLCRRLGLGLLFVRPGGALAVEVLLDPGPYRPRRHKARLERLLREFQRRVGDPTAGGSPARRPAMTAYRQEALRCAQVLAACGPTKASAVAATAGVPKAGQMLRRDAYGWFERAERGVYRLSPRGTAALEQFADQLPVLAVAPA